MRQLTGTYQTELHVHAIVNISDTPMIVLDWWHQSYYGYTIRFSDFSPVLKRKAKELKLSVGDKVKVTMNDDGIYTGIERIASND